MTHEQYIGIDDATVYLVSVTVQCSCWILVHLLLLIKQDNFCQYDRYVSADSLLSFTITTQYMHYVYFTIIVYKIQSHWWRCCNGPRLTYIHTYIHT